ncbi:hypothetical protein SAMN02910289_01991 [Lachnospiraceae bacterium RM5]|nr:hypothetical protein SAMN02910289_01991 [Lachnospiraceae bacterium RM5]
MSDKKKKRILIVSDTHGRDANLKRVLELEKDRDMLVHLGDIEGSEDFIRENSNCPICMVAGNNDYFTTLNTEVLFNIGPYKVLATHGHTYYISLGYEVVASEAKAQGAHIVMCGHTHKPVVLEKNGVTIINPGSLSYPRQEGRLPSYVIMEIDENDKIVYTIKYLNEN